MRQKGEQAERTLYIMGWIAIGIFVVVLFLKQLFPKAMESLITPCIFKMLTGYYCPGCGGTRAAKLFITGHWLKSFIYHPLVPYLGIGGGIFMITHTISFISNGRIKGIRFRMCYVYMMAAIIVIQFLVKNTLVAVWGFYII